jgi:hypothetical protein
MRKPIAIAIAMLSILPMSAQAPAPTRKKAFVVKTVTGTFEVKMLPPVAAKESEFVHLALDKTFAGPLEGTSRVEMMASNAGTSQSGGYVALEKFTGKLDGLSGGFIMQHSGTMSPGSMEIKVLVTPGSGTGALENISGNLEIRIEGKQHFYTLHYELPAKP